MSLKSIAEQLEKKIKSGEIRTLKQLEVEKALLSRQYSLPSLPKNADLIPLLHDKSVIDFMKMKPMRTLSGIANIAVMWMPEENEKTPEGRLPLSCPGSCIYCPQGKNSPKSYTGKEPATMRAQRFSYDPVKQIQNRLMQFRIMGHSTDKCELIIMGGTIMAWPQRKDFIKKCYDAFNMQNSSSLEEAINKNESASNRVVGLTIETRADYCNVEEMFSYGTTRVELGIQSTDDNLLKEINRGHNTQANIEAIRMLKEAGLKITAHWMPGLTGLDGEINFEKEVEDFRKLFNPDYQPDELKIYPVLVLPNTILHEKWKKGEYKALEHEQFLKLLKELKNYIPEHVRVKRIMRDISQHESEAGASITNIRQLLNAECRCIRCREIKDEIPSSMELVRRDYSASGGKEIFLSYEDKEKDKIIAFLRLRLSSSDTARIRELHVYGSLTPLGEKGDVQHSGLGKKLMKEAELIAKDSGKNKITVTSGVGVRNYYKNLGYTLKTGYMAKDL